MDRRDEEKKDGPKNLREEESRLMKVSVDSDDFFNIFYFIITFLFTLVYWTNFYNKKGKKILACLKEISH